MEPTLPDPITVILFIIIPRFSAFLLFKIVLEQYNHNEFLEKVEGFENDLEGGKRCEACIRLRLNKSFQYAKQNNFDFVTTTLSISPHKNADFINRCGKELEQIYGIPLLYADFKKENG